MKLRVKNFGPIRQAVVDIKPLTVFVGPSNTGKSYLAMLIYSIEKALGEVQDSSVYELIRLLTGDESSLDKILNDDNIDKSVGNSLSMYPERLRKLWERKAIHYFGEEWQNIVKQNGKATVSVEISDDTGKVNVNLFSSENEKLPAKDSIVKNIKEHIASSSKTGRNASWELERTITLQVANAFNLSTAQPRRDDTGTHYLPAVRGGVMQSHRTLVNAVVERAPTIGLIGPEGPEIIPFNGVLADFLKKLLKVGHVRRMTYRLPSNSDISEFANKIEKEILHGKIEVKMSETHYPDFRYVFGNKNEKNISLMNASSSVSELAPIVLFIRHYLSPNDMFIVEEPEAHLHPAAQRIIAGVLVELVNAGVRVITTTHSDVILEQISNHVLATQTKGKAKVQGDIKISPEKVAVYSFAQKSTGTIVKEESFDEDHGFLPKDHLNVSAGIYNEFAGLFNSKNDD